MSRSRLQDVGYLPAGWAEVAAGGSAEALGTVEQWLSSQSGHREAILNCDFVEIGVGYSEREGSRYTYYWVAILTGGQR